MALQQIPAATVSTGYTWTQRLGGLTNNLNTAAYNGSNMYVAAGGSGLIYSSPDGKTWTSRTSQFSTSGETVYKVAYGNALWVAVGGGGRISTSTDGITWTNRTANMSTNDINDVAYDNSIWVAVGAGGGTTNTGGLTYSTDGITWTRKSQSIDIGGQYQTVVWNGTNWLIGGTFSTYNYIYATTPSGTWTGDTENAADALHKIIWDGTRHTYFGTSIGWRYSTSTSTLTGDALLYGPGSVSSSAQTARTNIFYYSGIIYQGNSYHNNFAPTSTGVVAPTQLQFAPTAQLGNTAFSGVLTGVIAVPAGLIMLGAQKIFTSF